MTSRRPLFIVSLIIACALVGVSFEASAAVPANAPYEEPSLVAQHPRRVFSLTLSPLHLTLPILELSGEARVADKVGVAAIVGIGKYSETVNGTKFDASAFELGAQARYYVLGDFRHGMQLGVELLYLHLSDSQLVVKGEGLAMGPFVGYKFMADVGFTVEAQLGAEYIGARASSGSASASETSWIPLLNLNLGWSF